MKLKSAVHGKPATEIKVIRWWVRLGCDPLVSTACYDDLTAIFIAKPTAAAEWPAGCYRSGQKISGGMSSRRHLKSPLPAQAIQSLWQLPTL